MLFVMQVSSCALVVSACLGLVSLLSRPVPFLSRLVPVLCLNLCPSCVGLSRSCALLASVCLDLVPSVSWLVLALGPLCHSFSRCGALYLSLSLSSCSALRFSACLTLVPVLPRLVSVQCPLCLGLSFAYCLSRLGALCVSAYLSLGPSLSEAEVATRGEGSMRGGLIRIVHASMHLASTTCNTCTCVPSFVLQCV